MLIERLLFSSRVLGGIRAPDWGNPMAEGGQEEGGSAAVFLEKTGGREKPARGE